MAQALEIDGCKFANVIPTKDGKFRVCLSWKPSGEDMFEALIHRGAFTAVQAQKLADRVAVASKIDLQYWTWTPSVTSPIAVLQNPPV